ncbi:hypothetical protein DRP07_08115 [Archaeoglobales archaeon]|nr:MAG: hypothetical protein DRP07_08115 [Archaeoglobales archaeon]
MVKRIKMVKRKIREVWGKIGDQLKLAKRFLEEDRIDEALYFVWIAAENIVNTIKTAINGYYLKDHKEKSYVLKEYFAIGVLKKNYSGIFERLSKYRIAAEFHPYTSIPRSYSRKSVVKYLREVEELKREVEIFLKSKGVLK